MSKKTNNREIEYISEEDSGFVDKKLKKTKKALKQCQKEKQEYLAGWQRAKADLINYKKEQEQKGLDLFKFANENFILEILPVLDSFELALKHSKDEGLEQVYSQLKSILEKQGLEEIKALNEKFNPELHESVGEIKGKKQGEIVQEIQKGYKLNNKTIRPSRVKIGK